MNTFYTVAYTTAGLILPLFYLPQIRTCLRDTTGLLAFSMGKAFTQFWLRAAMLPFVFGVGNNLMTFIVTVDFLARGLEFGAALYSLRLQGYNWHEIGVRCSPAYSSTAKKTKVETPAPDQSTSAEVPAHVAVPVALASATMPVPGATVNADHSSAFTAEILVMPVGGEAQMTTPSAPDLPQPLMAVYEAWMSGKDLRSMYSKKEFGKNRYDLMKHGIDISTPAPSRSLGAANVAAFADDLATAKA